MIENSQDETPMVLKCKYLLKIYDEPWSDACLAKILTAHPGLHPDEGKKLSVLGFDFH